MQMRTSVSHWSTLPKLKSLHFVHGAVDMFLGLVVHVYASSAQHNTFLTVLEHPIVIAEGVNKPCKISKYETTKLKEKETKRKVRAYRTLRNVSANVVLKPTLGDSIMVE